MSNNRIPVAIIGVGGFGGRTLSALAASDAVEVVGVSDRDAAAAEQAARPLGIRAYGDNRSLLAETRPAAVYLAVPPAAAAELIGPCAERGIHVWTEAPLARSLDEGLAMVRRMEQGGLKLAVGTQRRFAPTYRRAWELFTAGRLGQVFLARAHYLFNWGPTLGWRGDRAAGGGALLELGYHPLDLLVWLLGVPEEVYGFSAAPARPAEPTGDAAPQPLYDTDDTAVAVLRVAAGHVATVVTTRRSGPVSEELCVHGRGSSLVVNAEACLLRDPDGHLLDEIAAGPPLDVFRHQGEAFARAVAENATHYECSARENLLNLAVIEAIYLSARTGQPESPLRLLHTRELSVADCLRYRPAPGETPPQ